MNLKNVLHRVAQGCGVCLPLLLIVGLLIPGCAGQRSDMLSSLIKPKQDAGKADVAAGESAKDDSASLIAGAEGKSDNSRLSAFSAEEIIEGPPRLRKRVRSWFTRKDQTLTTGDPFLEKENADVQDDDGEETAERQAIASSDSIAGQETLSSFQSVERAAKEPIEAVKPWWDAGGPARERSAPTSSESSRVDELLASFEAGKSAQQTAAADNEVQPWWEAGTTDNAEASSTTAHTAASTAPATVPKTTFSGQFDSRLERLRAELQLDGASDPSDADDEQRMVGRVGRVGRSASQQDRPHEQPEATIAGGSPEDEFNPFAATSEPSGELPIIVAHGEDPTEQCYPSLLTQPRGSLTEQESSAAATSSAGRSGSVDADRLATRENVHVLEGEDQSRELARKVAADRDSNGATALAGEPAAALETSPFSEVDPSGLRAGGTPFGFEDLDRLANPWTSKERTGGDSSNGPDPSLARAEDLQKTDADEPVVHSQSSGVSLLPPDDDFPSDADARDWSDADPRDISLATHRFPQFSRPEDEQFREQMKGLSAAENKALLQSIADQKNRVLKPQGTQWPELPAARQPGGAAEHSRGPIQVAEAPRFTLEDDIAIAAAPDSLGPAETSTSSGSSGSVLGQFWRSQPIWLIGGLFLLIIALRLWPWPKKDEA